jgi:hypothetical protein
MMREGMLSTPPAAIAALTLMGVSLQDWVLLATLGWLSMQIAYFIYQRCKEWWPTNGS